LYDLEEIEKIRLEFLKFQIQELNSFLRVVIENLVKWYTFFCTISILVVGAVIIRISDENSGIILAVAWVFLAVTILAVLTASCSILVFVKHHNRIKKAAQEINELIGGAIITPPVVRFMLVAISSGMLLSLIVLLLFWIYIIKLF